MSELEGAPGQKLPGLDAAIIAVLASILLLATAAVNSRNHGDLATHFIKIGSWANSNHDAIEAISALFSVVFSIILTGSTVFLWFATRNAARSAAESNALSRQAMIAEQRPWISVTVTLGGPITWDERGANFVFKFVCENSGRTPALNVTIDARLLGLFGVDARKQQLDLAQKTKHQTLRRGFTLFPGKNIPQQFEISLGNAELEAIMAKWKNDYNADGVDSIQPILVGCVSYNSAFDDERHQTGFIRDIMRTIPHNNSYDISKSGGDVPVDHLRLTIGLHDGYTD